MLKKTRIITRPDFDGIVCAVLLKEIFGDATPVLWIQPNQIQDGTLATDSMDVVANLPLNGPCKLWFDHHISNATRLPFEGLFRIAPSAARVVFEYFQDRLKGRFAELVDQADKIDAAQLSLEEIVHPERHPFILLSMCVSTRDPSDHAFSDHLVALLRSTPLAGIMEDDWVHRRSMHVIAANRRYREALKKHTHQQKAVAVTDFRGLEPPPDGNRFLVYSLFPDSRVNVKIFIEPPYTVIKLGHSILNRTCNVNVGCLLARYGGGGHRGAGACRLAPAEADRCLEEIITVLERNEPLEDEHAPCLPRKES
jgi:hypothetical protein